MHPFKKGYTYGTATTISAILNHNYSRFSLTAHYMKNDNFYFKSLNKCKINKQKYKNFYYSKNKDNEKLIVKLLMKLSFYYPNAYIKIKNILRSFFKKIYFFKENTK